MTEILFKDSIIQKGGRIKIPKAIIDTLDIKDGTGVIIKFDAEKESISINFEKRKKR